MHSSILKIQLFLNFAKGVGEHVPLATGSYVSDKKSWLNLDIFFNFIQFLLNRQCFGYNIFSVRIHVYIYLPIVTTRPFSLPCK